MVPNPGGFLLAGLFLGLFVGLASGEQQQQQQQQQGNAGRGRPDFDTDEEEIAHYGPIDRFWRYHAEKKTLVLGGVEYYDTIQSCMDEKLTPEEWASVRQPQELDRSVGTRFLDYEGKREVFLIEVKNAMSPIHAKAVRVLKDCVKNNISVLHEHRPMYQVYEVSESADQSLKDEMGGNNPTHLNSIIAIFLPDVVKEQYKTLAFAYHHAGWQALVVRDEILDRYRAGSYDAAFVPVEHAGMRACEYLTYEGFNNLYEHQDGFATSVVLNVFLSEGDAYEGGAFYMKDKVNEEYHHVRPDQYSALAFLGGTYDHGVDTIHSGIREALSTEFWYYPDLPPGVNLCAADFGNIEQHVRNCNKVQKSYRDGKVETDYSAHCDAIFPSNSIYGVCKSHFGEMRNIYGDQAAGNNDGAESTKADAAAATAIVTDKEKAAIEGVNTKNGTEL
ncbi:unnamed protein product [Pseudo-nitzschia multistriata]|uniref:Fe2OG dioxygenase domain-containing protein n=1 Tax=Pseudo-nitzschia multistriata TaxID=183589 RepID=A0A448Z357_9STRA|nr:unnamed protein product [Pseudo-nitzschia multistriata]